MESFLNRYRNITVLLLVIFAQLVLLAMQVKNDQDVRMIRVWTVTAVTPMARVVDWARVGSIGVVRDYLLLRDTNQENRRLQAKVDQLTMENNFLKNEMNTAERGKALAIFQAHTRSKTLAASIILTGAGANSKVVFVDRGTTAGVQRGMAVVTPDGIVGKVIAAYPTASEVLLVTDTDFAAGVISQKSMVRGTLKGQGTPMCKVDYVPSEEKIAVGDWMYTSGDDRIFPRGFPVGVVRVVRPGPSFQEIWVEPSGMQRGLEDVLILLEGVHQAIPDEPPAVQQIYLTPPPPDSQAEASPTPAGTEADKLRQRYKAVGDLQNHKFGESGVGEKPVNLNLKTPPAGGTNPAPAGRGAAPTNAARTNPTPPPPRTAPAPAAGTASPAPAGGGSGPTNAAGTNPAPPAAGRPAPSSRPPASPNQPPAPNQTPAPAPNDAAQPHPE
jgi:rod shape-determining protein MreC